jgi:glycerol-3-phosphate cytidylyltransferase
MISGYTSGYYDMFHVGHLNLLKRAKRLCDKLIVGVISDEECHKRKGKTPIIRLDQRLEIIAHLRCVNVAVPVFLDDKYGEWLKYHFHKIFVGSDHKNEEVWKMWEIVLQDCCQIIYLPYTQEVSSTLIKQRIIDEAAQKKTTVS